MGKTGLHSDLVQSLWVSLVIRQFHPFNLSNQYTITRWAQFIVYIRNNNNNNNNKQQHKIRHYKQNYHGKKYNKQKQIANADCADSGTHISTPNIGKRIIHRQDTVCAQLRFNICKEIGVKLDNKHGINMYQNYKKQVMKVR